MLFGFQINFAFAQLFSVLSLFILLANSFRTAGRVMNLTNEERLEVTFDRTAREVHLKDCLLYVAGQTHYTHRDQ
jgi:hypothetical protein